MTPSEPDPLTALTALGHVDPPPPGVLAAAREALWSAIAQEMVTTDPAARRAASRERDTPRRVRRPLTGPPDPGQ